MTKRRTQVSRLVCAAVLGAFATLVGGCATSITGGEDADPVTSGATLTYHYGAGDDSGIGTLSVSMCVRSTLPAGVTLVSATTLTGPGCTGTSPIICDVGVLGADQLSEVTIEVTVDAAAPAELSHYVSFAPCDCGADLTCDGQITNDGDNEVTTTTTVVECITNADCDDGIPATTDTCSANVCSHIEECMTVDDCYDGDSCTVDACDAGTCTHDSGMPMPCTTTSKHKLQISGDGMGVDDKLLWKWLNGSSSDYFQFSPPEPSILCVSDANGTVLGLQIGGGLLWQETGSGFKQVDATGVIDGVTKMVLKHGAGKAKIILKGKGANLPDRSTVPLTPPVDVYWRTLLGCWGSTYTLDDVVKNDGIQFKAKVP